MDERTHPMAATNLTESRDSRFDRLAWGEGGGEVEWYTHSAENSIIFKISRMTTNIK